MKKNRRKMSDIISETDEIFNYFKFNYKNLTKKQFEYILDLQDAIHEICIKINEGDFKRWQLIFLKGGISPFIFVLNYIDKNFKTKI